MADIYECRTPSSNLAAAGDLSFPGGNPDSDVVAKTKIARPRRSGAFEQYWTQRLP